MATLHTQGTLLDTQPASRTLIKPFLWSIGLIFCLAMHFFQPNPGGSGLLLPFNPAVWLAVSFCIAIGLYETGAKRSWRYSSLTIGLLVVCILLTIPVFYSASVPQDAITRLIGLWGGWLFFCMLQQFQFSIKQRQTLLWFILIGVLIEIVYAYIQYLVLQPGNPLGYNTVSNRPFGIFQQPNVMASFVATGLVISGYLLARQHQSNEKYHPLLNGLLYLFPIISMPLLWVLASRTGWLGGIVGCVLLLPYLKRFLSAKQFSLWCFAVVLGLAAGYGIAEANGGNKLIEQKSNLESPRRYTFPQTLDMVIEKPLTGYGYGRFEPAYIVYTARQHQITPDYHAGLASMDHPHNELLYWAVEGGIVPLMGLLLATLLVLRKIRKVSSGARLATAALFFPLVLHTQLEYPFYHSAVHWVIFIMLIYWLDQLTSQYQTAGFSSISKSFLSIVSLVLPILTTFYMISALQTNIVLNKFERSRQVNPELLQQVTNPSVWKDRFDWDVYKTQLNIGLVMEKPEYIQPFIDWANEIIKHKPRPAFYSSLIVAYQGLGEMDKAQAIRHEAEFLFPNQDFSKVRFIPKAERASHAQSQATTGESTELTTSKAMEVQAFSNSVMAPKVPAK
uniref:Ligase n=1 Tax=Vibrio algicola TaxID=2662262 RepID=A0A5Q0TCC3_9VIBR